MRLPSFNMFVAITAFLVSTVLYMVEGKILMASISFALYLFSWFVKAFIELDDIQDRIRLLKCASYELRLYIHNFVRGFPEAHYHGTMFVGLLVDALYFWRRERCNDCGEYDCDNPNCLPF
jgi:hypothetical protein